MTSLKEKGKNRAHLDKIIENAKRSAKGASPSFGQILGSYDDYIRKSS